MDGISWLQIISYAAFAVFAIVFVAKAKKYATTPLHVRWELYPVAHEKGEGSYLQEMDWWTKPRKKSLIGELTYMVREIFLLEEYYHRNRGFWYVLYPFHIGGYLFVTWLVLLLVGALSMVADVTVSAESASSWGQLVHYLTQVAGVASFVVGAIACTGLLIKRSTDEDLKHYTTRMDYFSLLLILAVFVSGFVAWLAFDLTFAPATEYMEGLITLGAVADISPALTAHILILSLFAVYMPFTRMMHFLAKYFTFHTVRWEDTPNLKGSAIEKKVEALLNKTVTWSAPHIQTGKTWAEVATSEIVPEVEEKK